jgi:hypothetical protein
MKNPSKPYEPYTGQPDKKKNTDQDITKERNRDLEEEKGRKHPER